MTLQQLQYAVALADSNTFSNAAKTLFVSQPTLSNSIQALENELGITIFSRSRKGISLTPVGYAFIDQARQIVQESDQLTRQFQGKTSTFIKRFCISSPRFEFVDRVFSSFASSSPDNYDMIHAELSNNGAIQYVAQHISEIGIVYLSENSKYMQRYFRENDLVFHPLYQTDFGIIVRIGHPLCEMQPVSLSDLQHYPYLGYVYGEGSPHVPNDEDPLYYKFNHHKSIRVMDKQELNYLINHTDGYSPVIGLFNEQETVNLFRILPLQEKIPVTIGWIHRRDKNISDFCLALVHELEQEVKRIVDTSSRYTLRIENSASLS